MTSAMSDEAASTLHHGRLGVLSIVFFVVAFTIGQRAVDVALKRVRANGGDQLAGMTVVLVTTLSFGVVTQWLHVEAVLGAFIAGVISSSCSETGVSGPSMEPDAMRKRRE